MNKTYRKSELNEICKRRLKDLEDLFKDRNLRKIFEYTNPKGERYLFAKFVKNRTDEIIATIAFWDGNVGWVTKSY